MKKIFAVLITLLLAASIFSRQVQAIEYPLPYPGVLPDSPIYFFKVLRDKLISWTLFDPADRAFYLILLSDKRLAAAQVLVNTGKVDLGTVTLLQAEALYKNSVDTAALATKEKRSDLLAKLLVAGSKHSEVINLLRDKIGNNNINSWKKAFDDNASAQSRVMELYLQR